MGIVYKLTFPSGKSYIGVTTETLERRVKRHISYARAGKRYAISSAIRKYGEKSFSSEEIARSDDKSILLTMEVQEIIRHNTQIPYGYNMTGGGEGSNNYSPSVETRVAIAKALKGRKLSEMHRRAISSAQAGKTIPPETRKKMSEAHKNRPPMSDEQKAIRSAAAKRNHALRTGA